MKSILLKNATLIDLDPVRIEKGDLRIENGKISVRGKSLRKKPSDKVVKLDGKLILPGQVCAHTHLYSTLARGMPALKSPPQNFLEILKKIWWRIDWAHNEETIYYSALVGAIEAAQCGTTLLIDHHASPCFIKGSLKIIRQALEEVGLRGVLCYEVTDRGGVVERDAGVEENVDFISRHRTHPRFRGLFGAHASFTLSNDSLRVCSRLAGELETGLHSHAAEDECDVRGAEEKYSQGVVERIEAFDGLNHRTLLAHGTHLSAAEIERVEKADAWLVHNPRSNMNNAVGYACPSRFGKRVALGTDGIDANMFEEARFAFFKWRDAQSADYQHEGNPWRPYSSKSLDALSLLANNHRLASEIFESTFGKLSPKAEADLIILSYESPTPLTPDNLLGHLIFGMNASHVESVMVSGEFVVENRRISRLNVAPIYEKARTLTTRLWNRAF